jgi:hypothetical protein
VLDTERCVIGGYLASSEVALATSVADSEEEEDEMEEELVDCNC